MDLGLTGRKALISGGSRGIGRAVLELLAREGCDVGFFSRDAAQVEEAALSLRKHGHRVVADALDMSDANSYRAWLANTADKLGGCDIFIHNASASGSQATMDWQKNFEIDILGAVTAVQVLEPYLEKSGAGSFVMMSTTAAVETFLYPQAFNAMKAALLTYSKQLSQMWAAKGIRVNAVSPGPISYPGGNWEYIKTNMSELYQSTLSAMPMQRFGGPEEVANAVVFLSSQAASYITGVNLVVDGGFTKRVQF
jgi:3-oxoacyl-[acyl-carrier protein] reductase